MSLHPHLDDEVLDPDEQPTERLSALRENITAEAFDEWYHEWKFRKNIREGNSYYNKAGYVPDPERHSPSSLMQCQRKTFYDNENAPEEEEAPEGIFWMGEVFEEEILMPFLEAIAEDIHHRNYVQNSMWVDFELEHGGTDVHFRGETDPVVCDAQGNPILITEIKSKKTLSKFEGVEDPDPDIHHKAQVHCYMYGLTKSFERRIDKAMVIYGSRNNHELQPIPVDFDLEFWEEQVVPWAARHTEFRIEDELPPADPQFSWECKFCDYSQRCGQTEDPGFRPNLFPDHADWRDVGVDGFLPLVEYPQRKVVNYLRAHAPKGAKLTPTLAGQHPELTQKFDVFPWQCPSCDNEYVFGTFGWDGDTDSPPWCPDCEEDQLRGPLPSEQHD